MRHQLDQIILNLKECFDGTPWYGDSVMKKIDVIDWRITNSALYGSKSIAVLVQHMINWRIFVIKKLKGDSTYDVLIDGPTDWTQIQIGSLKEWESLKTKLRQTQQDILHLLTDHSDELLHKIVPGKEYTFGPILTSIAQHDIYHLGQIAMLNTMQRT